MLKKWVRGIEREQHENQCCSLSIVISYLSVLLSFQAGSCDALHDLSLEEQEDDEDGNAAQHR